jgi:hypothetical protein
VEAPAPVDITISPPLFAPLPTTKDTLPEVFEADPVNTAIDPDFWAEPESSFKFPEI